jgi:hypothetical protein
MSKVPVFLIVLFLAGAASAALAPGLAPETPLLRDGCVLTGVDGTLVGPDGNDVWFFELASDVNDSRTVIKRGTRLELLPSSALEKMIAEAKAHLTAAFRLWDARVTRYKGRNFIFPDYFQPLRKPAPSAARGAQGATRKTEARGPNSVSDKSEPALNEPNDVLSLPPDILEKLRARREKAATGAQRPADSNQAAAENENLPNAKSYGQSTDRMFVGRTAFLVRQDDGRLTFVPDALGRNIEHLTLYVLPCEALEMAERQQAAEPEPVRFKIAGIMTEYKGKTYLLLQRATRAYSHDNFGK